MQCEPRLIPFMATAMLALCGYVQADTAIKVFILAGQSNMEGKGRVETGLGGVDGAIGSLRYMVNTDPANYGHLVDSGGTWVARNDVWIYSTTGSGNSVEKGNLTVGFGTDAFIGPELGFGSVMGNVYGEQILLIKTAWGGKSLAVDFRPPSSGGTVGPYYNQILSIVSDVLGNIAAEFPGYSGQGVELAGFGWHQGWNDRVTPAFNAEYEQNMANFIKDIRFDLHAPDLPFVIATTGMTGWGETNTSALSLMAAQLAMADTSKYPEFAGNVAVVDTRSFWRPVAESPVTKQEYHWNGNGETYYLIGDGMGDAMTTLDYEPQAYHPLGDLNMDGHVNAFDWLTFLAGSQVDLSALDREGAYLRGDLDKDFDNDIYDFDLFRIAYEEANGQGAFAAMVASMPEPSSMMLLAAGAAGVGMRRRKRTRQAHTAHWDRSDQSTVPPLPNPLGNIDSTIFNRRNS